MFWKLYEDILNGVYSPHTAITFFFYYFNFSGSEQAQMVFVSLGLVQSLTEHSTHQRLLLSIVWILYLWSKELAVTYLGYITPRSGGQHFWLTAADRSRSESEDESQNI